ncbi:hypothetical protein [Rhizobium sp.]|uniref:hypothetical protein n=1 Tax=Rhizobium sp. TaxID=391 RepID=UPI0034C682C6
MPQNEHACPDFAKHGRGAIDDRDLPNVFAIFSRSSTHPPKRDEVAQRCIHNGKIRALWAGSCSAAAWWQPHLNCKPETLQFGRDSTNWGPADFNRVDFWSNDLARGIAPRPSPQHSEYPETSMGRLALLWDVQSAIKQANRYQQMPKDLAGVPLFRQTLEVLPIYKDKLRLDTDAYQGFEFVGRGARPKIRLRDDVLILIRWPVPGSTASVKHQEVNSVRRALREAAADRQRYRQHTGISRFIRRIISDFAGLPDPSLPVHWESEYDEDARYYPWGKNAS